MQIFVRGYNADGTLGEYDLEVKAKEPSCDTKKEQCSNGIFIAVIIAILCLLSFICLQGGVARVGTAVSVKGDEGEAGCAGKQGKVGPNVVQLGALQRGMVTQELLDEKARKKKEFEKKRRKMEEMKKRRQRKIDQEIAEGKRLKSGVLVS